MSKLFEKIPMEGIKKIIVVASGKGGVGKSTIAANLAITLARNGLRTALVDADIYGPSIPRMFGIEDAKPEVTAFGDQEMIFPIIKYGVKIMSIGFFVDRNQSLIWRGLMASNALTQLFKDTQWGDIDFMIVDFPPGTGDIQLTTIQKLNVSGAIMVTTPQVIALNDVSKAASMFVHPDVGVPILGIIENMSWFTPEKHPDEKYFIFGKGGARKIASEFNIRLLGQVPLVMDIGKTAEKGMSIFNTDNKEVIQVFEKIAEILITSTGVKA